MSTTIDSSVVNEASLPHRSIIQRLILLARDSMARPMFGAIERHCRGDLLDIGGADFYFLNKRRFANLPIRSWTCLEPTPSRLPQADDRGMFKTVVGDGCDMPFESNSFDSILNLQVLEHVFEPLKMVDEIARVLRPGGHAVIVAPQTTPIHMIPDIYNNLTIYWMRKAMGRSGLRIVEERGLGGVWKSVAFRLVHFVLQAMRYSTFSSPEYRRNWCFYLLLPFMLLYTAISIPICLIFSLGDLTEDPTNNLLVVQKPL
jgi:SAM-dependent methyltransferase